VENATTLESAVESLLAPEVGGEPTQEDNLREAAGMTSLLMVSQSAGPFPN